jgi:hypothetical protein
MIKSFLKILGLGGAIAVQSAVAQLPAPYERTESNFIYNLLFCDDASLFAPKNKSNPNYWEKALFLKPELEEIKKIAENSQEESRIRALAYNSLKKSGAPVPKGILLGVIVEVPLEGGLDVLAAYLDGRVRYINQTGKMTFVEGGSTEIERLAKELVVTALPIVKKIGPWEKPRLPSPKKGNIRLSFLVSDGLYFGEGPFALMQKDQMAAPVINKAIELLQVVVNKSTEKPNREAGSF